MYSRRRYGDPCVHAVVPRAKGHHCTTRAEEDRMIQCGSWAKDGHCFAAACYTVGASEQEEREVVVEVDLMN